jgi:hypothetical protein
MYRDGKWTAGSMQQRKEVTRKFCILCLEGNIMTKILVMSGGLRDSENFEVNFGRAVWEASIETWILSINGAFAVGANKIAKTRDPVGRL